MLPDHNGTRTERITRYRKGRGGEIVAAALLIAKGYRILQWRARNRAGEIDLIGLRGRRLAFVEVKYRRNLVLARSAISRAQQQRLIRVAQNWVAQNSRYRNHELGMDAIFICPWSWPRHEKNVFYFDE